MNKDTRRECADKAVRVALAAWEMPEDAAERLLVSSNHTRYGYFVTVNYGAQTMSFHFDNPGKYQIYEEN
jgi:hypothetical protein